VSVNFADLPDAEKDRIYREIDQAPPGEIWRKSKPMTAADRKAFAPIRKKMGRGRPKTGRGTKVVSVSVEIGLLAEADAFAKRAGLGRTDLFVRGLRMAMGLASGG